jgi:hypothetical protein
MRQIFWLPYCIAACAVFCLAFPAFIPGTCCPRHKFARAPNIPICKMSIVRCVGVILTGLPGLVCLPPVFSRFFPRRAMVAMPQGWWRTHQCIPYGKYIMELLHLLALPCFARTVPCFARTVPCFARTVPRFAVILLVFALSFLLMA